MSASWKAFLLRLAMATSVFALANLGAYYTSGYFVREREYHADVAGFFDRPRARALFAGDSHVAQLENDLLADDAYNVAWGGDSLREVYAKFRYLLARHARIDTLYVSADPHMFGSGRLQSSNRAFVDPYLLVTASPYGMEHGWPSAALGAIPLFNDDFVQYLKRSMGGSLKRSGFAAAQEDPLQWQRLSEEERIAIARATGEEDHAGIGAHADGFASLARIADLARGHSVRVVAVFYPAHAAYLDSISPADTIAIEQELSKLGISDVLDFRNVFSDPRLFEDPDHLNRQGAIELLRLMHARTGRQLLATGLTPSGTDRNVQVSTDSSLHSATPVQLQTHQP